MSISDLLASAGVTLLLVAFLLNLKKLISPDNVWYILLNAVGAALCGISAYMIDFYPFVVLEAVWAGAALVTLVKRVSRGTLNRIE